MKTTTSDFRNFCRYVESCGIELKTHPKKFGSVILQKGGVISSFEFPNEVDDLNRLTYETLPKLFGILPVVLLPRYADLSEPFRCVAE